MKVTLESTTRLVEVAVPGRFGESITCRVWEGTTASGVPVQALIPRIATPSKEALLEFERDLQECRASRADFDAFPARLIL